MTLRSSLSRAYHTVSAEGEVSLCAAGTPPPSRFTMAGGWLRRGARSWAGVVAVAVACSLLASSARAAAPAALTRDTAADRLLRAGSPTPLAQLEARAAELSRQYRGRLETLTGAETAAEAATARVQTLGRQLDAAHRQLARLGLRHRGVGPGQRLPARHHVHHLPAADLGRPDGVLRLGPDGEPRQHHREPLRPRAHLGVLETRQLRLDGGEQVTAVGERHGAPPYGCRLVSTTWPDEAGLPSSGSRVTVIAG